MLHTDWTLISILGLFFTASYNIQRFTVNVLIWHLVSAFHKMTIYAWTARIWEVFIRNFFQIGVMCISLFIKLKGFKKWSSLMQNEIDCVRHRKPIGMAYGSKTSTVTSFSKTYSQWNIHKENEQQPDILGSKLIHFLERSWMRRLIPLSVRLTWSYTQQLSSLLVMVN